MSVGRDSEPPPDGDESGTGAGDASDAGEEARSGQRQAVADASDKRSASRVDVMWSVDCQTDDTFLYASITNISALGIFVQTTEPLPVGATLHLRFASDPHAGAFVLRGRVQWLNEVRPLGDNPNPGMGIMFLDLTADERERLVEVVKTIAYLRSDPSSEPTTN